MHESITLTYEIKLLFAQFEVYLPACTFVLLLKCFARIPLHFIAVVPLAVSVKKTTLYDLIILIGYYVVYFDFNAFSEIIIIALSVDS